MPIQGTKTIVIYGSEVQRGEGVLAVIDSLYLLPMQYQLVVVGSPADQDFYNELVEIIEEFNLSTRVLFRDEQKPDLIVSAMDNTLQTCPRVLFSKDNETVASDILRALRYVH